MGTKYFRKNLLGHKSRVNYWIENLSNAEGWHEKKQISYPIL